MSYTNPDPPPGRMLRDAEVTPAMSAFAIEVDHDPQRYPMFSATTRQIGGKTIVAWVNWHDYFGATGQRAQGIRGVTLLEASAGTPVTPSPPVAAAQAEGVDVSHYQGTIDWAKVAAAGKSFAFVKATEGVALVDPRCDVNIKGADESGLLVGAYHFLRPRLDAAEQAKRLVDAAGHCTLPFALDVETYDGTSPAELRDVVAAFLASLAAPCVVYTAPNFVAAGAIPDGVDLWIAHWGVEAPGVAGWRFWQYSQTGTVPGVAGRVDLDRFAGSVEALQEYASPSPDTPRVP